MVVLERHLRDRLCDARTARAHAGEGPMTDPAWSHDGRTIAFTGQRCGDDASGRFNTELLTVDADGGRSFRCRRPSTGPSRAPSSAICARVSPCLRRRGATTIARSSRSSATRAPAAFAPSPAMQAAIRHVAGGKRDIFAFSLCSGGIALAFSTPEIPSDLGLLLPDGMPSSGLPRSTTTGWPARSSSRRGAIARSPPTGRPSMPGSSSRLQRRNRFRSCSKCTAARTSPTVMAFSSSFRCWPGPGLRRRIRQSARQPLVRSGYADAITGDWGGIDADDVQRILDGALAAANDRSRARRSGRRFVRRVHDDVAAGSQRPFRRRRFDACGQRLRQ